jgi:plastocyanin
MPFARRLRLGLALTLFLGTVAARAETIEVVIDKLAFAPKAIEAKVGDTIHWVNRDPFAHTATVKGGWEVMIPAKATASQALDNAEAVDFYCRFHPNMRGKLTVTER